MESKRIATDYHAIERRFPNDTERLIPDLTGVEADDESVQRLTRHDGRRRCDEVYGGWIRRECPSRRRLYDGRIDRDSRRNHTEVEVVDVRWIRLVHVEHLQVPAASGGIDKLSTDPVALRRLLFAFHFDCVAANDLSIERATPLQCHVLIWRQYVEAQDEPTDCTAMGDSGSSHFLEINLSGSEI